MDSSSVCGVQRSLSVLDRLLLTHSIWLQLSVATDTAVNILQREPVGTFMVCKCVSAHKKVLCVRIGTDNSTSAVKQHRIREEESTFALEGSALSFPDLCRLVAFYCVSRDVLPFPLELPETIAQASSHTQLEAISHLGSEFWSSQHTTSSSSSSTSSSCLTPPNGPPATGATGSLAPPPHHPHHQQHHQHHHRPTPCFINPLFLQPPDPPEERAASSKRHRFRRSLRVRVSTETSLSLSSGGDSGAGSGSGAGIGAGGGGGREQRQQLANHTVQRMLKRSPAMSPTSEEEDEIMAQHAYQDPASGDVGSVDHEPGEETSCTVEDACLSLQTTRAPSLAALDSNSSFSSLEEDDDDYYETGESTMSHHGRSILTTATTASSSSSSSTMSVTSANSQRPSLKRMSAAFVCLFAPERRVARLVLQLSRDPRSAFGALVQEFLCGKRAQLTALQGADGGGSTGGGGSAAEALQGVRKFLTQAKGFLLGSGELEPPIETLVPENEKDLALEKAMFGCVLKPLRVALDKALQASATNDGSLVRLSEGMRACQPGCPRQKLGVPEGVGLLDCAGVSRARRKLALMSRSHSPIDKVLLLLQVCKRVYQSLGTQPGQDVMSEHFLPALAYVLVHCNMPQLLLEVQYMMELLEPSWLTGEGGYYLTSTYASLCLIQSHPQAPPVGGMTSEAQEKLREWSQRRGQERYTHATTNQNQRLVRVLYQEGGQSVVRTLHWAEGEPASSLALSCATAFAVSQPQRYGLFCRALAGEMKPLPPNALIHDAHAHSDMGGGGLPSLSYLRVDHDAGKVRRLTRGGAVDLGGSVCEE